MNKLLTLVAVSLISSLVWAVDTQGAPFVQLGAGINTSGTNFAQESRSGSFFSVKIAPSAKLGIGYEFTAYKLRLGTQFAYLGRFNELQAKGDLEGFERSSTNQFIFNVFANKAYPLGQWAGTAVNFVAGGKLGLAYLSTSVAAVTPNAQGNGSSQSSKNVLRVDNDSSVGFYTGLEFGTRFLLGKHLSLDTLIPVDLVVLGKADNDQVRMLTQGSGRLYWNAGFNLNLSYHF